LALKAGQPRGVIDLGAPRRLTGTRALPYAVARAHSRMHELSIAQSVVRETERRLREAGVRPDSARVVNVAVGDLSGADPSALEEAFAALLPRSALADATAEVRRDPARVVCPKCGTVEAGTPFRIECPRCGGMPERIEGGRDITVESVEVDDREANTREARKSDGDE